MKRIKVLIWEGIRLPENDHESNLVLHSDPSNESGTVSVIIKNQNLISELESIFMDEMLESISENEFDSLQDISDIKAGLEKMYEVHYIEFHMTPQFINGGRQTQENFPKKMAQTNEKTTLLFQLS